MRFKRKIFPVAVGEREASIVKLLQILSWQNVDSTLIAVGLKAAARLLGTDPVRNQFCANEGHAVICKVCRSHAGNYLPCPQHSIFRQLTVVVKVAISMDVCCAQETLANDFMSPLTCNLFYAKLSIICCSSASP